MNRDLIDFIDNIDTLEFIEYRKVDALTLVFKEYMRTVEIQRGKSKAVDSAQDLRLMGRVYAYTPPRFILKLQVRYSLLQELFYFYTETVGSSKYWILRIAGIFVDSLLLFNQDLLMDVLCEWSLQTPGQSLLVDLEEKMKIVEKMTQIEDDRLMNVLEVLASYQPVSKDGQDLMGKVKDVFPDYGDQFIQACLDVYDNNVETVIMKILEEDLDSKLKDLDRNAKNVKITKLKKENKLSALDDEYKARILEYQYDSYDDEYDDTFDYSDVKLNVLTDLQDLEHEDPIQVNEARLVGILESNPSFFSQAEKKSQERIKFCQETGLSNQQIEGWYSNLQRNPRQKQSILEKYEWQGNSPLEEEVMPETNTSEEGNKRGSYRGRGGNHGRKRGHIRKLEKGM